MATRSFQGKTIPPILSVGHGLLAAAGLVTLLIAAIQGTGGNFVQYALIILLIAALGGFFLLSFHIRRQRHPKGVIVIHAAVAVIGVLALLGAFLPG